MKEIDLVVDVRQSPDTAELIVLKQKVAFSGEASLVVEQRRQVRASCSSSFYRRHVTTRRRPTA